MKAKNICKDINLNPFVGDVGSAVRYTSVLYIVTTKLHLMINCKESLLKHPDFQSLMFIY